ncbi:hypothetical protein BU17DRAFT_69163 [Hysterangium stoloniferum]|nr:hypothetical protein BU17DRAFT_69163 [Hysterangium stoloniferum]
MSTLMPIDFIRNDGPFGLVALSYLVSRYGFLGYIVIFTYMAYVPVGILQNLGGVILEVTFLEISLFGTQTLILLRTTALSGRNNVISGIMLLFALISWSLYIWLYPFALSPFNVCNESLIIAVVVYYTRHYFIARQHSDTACKGSLTELLVKQGILRYWYVFPVTLMHAPSPINRIMLFWNISLTVATFVNIGDGPQLVHDYSVSMILICRMILELRKFSRHPNNTSRTRPDDQHTSIIPRFIRRMHRDVVDEFTNSLTDADEEIDELSSIGQLPENRIYKEYAQVQVVVNYQLLNADKVDISVVDSLTVLQGLMETTAGQYLIEIVLETLPRAELMAAILFLEFRQILKEL